MKLHNLINPELVTNIEGNQIRLEEKQTEDDTLKEVIITQIPDNVFVFNLDKEIIKEYKDNGNMKQCINQFLNAEREYINKRCDYIIFYYESNELYLFFCELKSKKPKPNEYETQLINSKIFIDYLFNLFKIFFPDEHIPIKKTKYILFYLRRTTLIDDVVRGRVEMQYDTENMINYKENIITKYPLKGTHHNYIKWEDLIANLNPN